jgi:hypothetical protein
MNLFTRKKDFPDTIEKGRYEKLITCCKEFSKCHTHILFIKRAIFNPFKKKRYKKDGGLTIRGWGTLKESFHCLC